MTAPTIEQAIANMNATKAITADARMNPPEWCQKRGCQSPTHAAVVTMDNGEPVCRTYCCRGHLDEVEANAALGGHAIVAVL